MALLIGQQPTGRGFGRERRRNGIVGRSFHIFGNRKRITWIDTKGCNQLVYSASYAQYWYMRLVGLEMRTDSACLQARKGGSNKSNSRRGCQLANDEFFFPLQFDSWYAKGLQLKRKTFLYSVLHQLWLEGKVKKEKKKKTKLRI